ncbi:MAG TPA: PQQ-binding-like beta-propeller repeat protein, partial [Planctomycetia bacterium]|nr:PQQ-binding-like beta-propeller repeat protein [Planctomycetia bacterium]
IYVAFGKAGVFAFDRDGKKLWRADIGDGLNGWGSAVSPVLHGDLVIVNASVESRSVIALDRKTGKEVWRAGDIREAWNVPTLVPLPQGKAELVVPMLGQVVGLDPDSGEKLWTCQNDIKWYIVPSVVADKGVLWSIGGRSGTAAAAIRAGGRGDVTADRRLWIGAKGSNVSSPIHHHGKLYWVNDSSGVAGCADAETGKLLYEERLPRGGQFYASAVMAGDKIYYLSRTGKTFVVAAKPEFELLATNDLGERGMFNASPAIVAGRLYIRSDKFLYCIGGK